MVSLGISCFGLLTVDHTFKDLVFEEESQEKSSTDMSSKKGCTRNVLSASYFFIRHSLYLIERCNKIDILLLYNVLCCTLII